MNPLAPLPVPAPPASAGAAALSSPPPVSGPRPAAPTLTREAPAPAARTDVARGLEQKLERAAVLLHRDRDVAVETRRDEAADRLVVRVRDRNTGEVVAQYPPEELLRFWAAVRGEERLLDLRT